MRRIDTSIAFSSFFSTFALTTSASAEVLDKLALPWEPHQYIRMLIVLVCTGVLAASVRRHVRIAGLVVAIAWATLSLWADPWFTQDIGNALRAELTNEQSTKWLQTILVQALAPLAVTLIVFLWRTRTNSLGLQSPR
jgi:hypothetical protein